MSPQQYQNDYQKVMVQAHLQCIAKWHDKTRACHYSMAQSWKVKFTGYCTPKKLQSNLPTDKVMVTIFHTNFLPMAIADHPSAGVAWHIQQTSGMCSRGNFKQNRSYIPPVNSTPLSTYVQIIVFPTKWQFPSTVLYSTIPNLYVYTFKSTVQSGNPAPASKMLCAAPLTVPTAHAPVHFWCQLTIVIHPRLQTTPQEKF
jgi:hypothetical protein